MNNFCLLYTSDLNTTTLNLNTGAPNLTFRGYKRKNGDVGAVSYTHLDVYKRQPLKRCRTPEYKLPDDGYKS